MPPSETPWYAAWPPRPPRDEEACPTCGYGLDDGTETEHECPPGFLLLAPDPPIGDRPTYPDDASLG